VAGPAARIPGPSPNATNGAISCATRREARVTGFDCGVGVGATSTSAQHVPRASGVGDMSPATIELALSLSAIHALNDRHGRGGHRPSAARASTMTPIAFRACPSPCPPAERSAQDSRGGPPAKPAAALFLSSFRGPPDPTLPINGKHHSAVGLHERRPRRWPACKVLRLHGQRARDRSRGRALLLSRLSGYPDLACTDSRCACTGRLGEALWSG
jgi:hypothetical protein